MGGWLPVLLLAVTVGVVFVNGWTDAPNAIATAVSTGAISYRRAVSLAAACNLLGLLFMGLLSTSVADTMVSVARFDGVGKQQAVAGLCAAMLSIVFFAVGAWWFGIPTSESHALIAALGGAGLALGSTGGMNVSAWGKVVAGLVLSVGMGLLLGFLFTKVLGRSLSRLGDRRLDRFQVWCAGGMAFLHGAQDGQKFVAVLVMVDQLSKGLPTDGPVRMGEHLPAFALCGAVMACGTAVGGKRIVNTVGEKMASLRKYQGVCADLAGGVCLLAASLTGVPMSTTHTKTCAVMGTGLAGSRGKVHFGVMGGMFFAWAVTFPVCGAVSFLLTRLFAGLL